MVRRARVVGREIDAERELTELALSHVDEAFDVLRRREVRLDHAGPVDAASNRREERIRNVTGATIDDREMDALAGEALDHRRADAPRPDDDCSATSQIQHAAARLILWFV